MVVLLVFCGCGSGASSSSQPVVPNAVDEDWSWAQTPPTFTITRYVRPPGQVYGTGDGSSWTNASSDLPAKLERGTRYYLASGNYDIATASTGYVYHRFDDLQDGEKYIGLFKATSADHGTDDGWETPLGEGAAALGPITMITPYYLFDGQVGEGESGYGIKVSTRDCDNDQAKVVNFPWDSKSGHVVFRHLDMGHCGDRVSCVKASDCGENGYLKPTQDVIYGSKPASHIYIDNCFLHDANRLHVLMANWQRVLIHRSHLVRAGRHQESSSLSPRNTSDLTVRYCVFKDTVNTFISLREVDNVRIYGNIFMGAKDWEIYSAVENTDGLPAYHVFVHGNTFYNLKGLFAGIRFWDTFGDLQVFNNLWVGCRVNDIQLCGDHDYNAFFDNRRVDPAYSLDDRIEEPNKSVLTANPFVDAVHEDFHLAAPTPSGLNLPAPYNTDRDGKQRGSDGVWDRGAYEYVKP